MALALPWTFCPLEVPVMDIRTCSRHKISMVEVPGTAGYCYRCPVPGCDQSIDLPPSGGGGQPPRQACVKPEPMPEDNELIERAFGYQAGHVVDEARWKQHVARVQEQLNAMPGIPRVPQSNSRIDYSLMNGPPAPGGGSKSGRRRKKNPKGGKKFIGSGYDEGGTNSK
jgi:hypothetical protein